MHRIKRLRAAQQGVAACRGEWQGEQQGERCFAPATKNRAKRFTLRFFEQTTLQLAF